MARRFEPQARRALPIGQAEREENQPGGRVYDCHLGISSAVRAGRVSSLLVRKPATELAVRRPRYELARRLEMSTISVCPGGQFRHGETVHIRKLDVYKHQIGAKRSSGLKRGSPVRRLSGDGKAARLEKRTSGCTKPAWSSTMRTVRTMP